MKPVMVESPSIPKSFAQTPGSTLITPDEVNPFNTANTIMDENVFANVQHAICIRPPMKNDRKNVLKAPM